MLGTIVVHMHAGGRELGYGFVPQCAFREPSMHKGQVGGLGARCQCRTGDERAPFRQGDERDGPRVLGYAGIVKAFVVGHHVEGQTGPVSRS